MCGHESLPPYLSLLLVLVDCMYIYLSMYSACASFFLVFRFMWATAKSQRYVVAIVLGMRASEHFFSNWSYILIYSF